MSDGMIVIIEILIGAGLVFGLCRIWFGPLKRSLDNMENGDSEEFHRFQTALDAVSEVVYECHDNRCYSDMDAVRNSILLFAAADRFFFSEDVLRKTETSFYKGLKAIDAAHPEISEQTGQIRRFMERFYFA